MYIGWLLIAVSGVGLGLDIYFMFKNHSAISTHPEAHKLPDKMTWGLSLLLPILVVLYWGICIVTPNK